MKIRIIIACILLSLLTASCSKEEEPTIIPPGADMKAVSLAAGNTDASVLIFEKKGNDFLYQNTINSGWSESGTLTTYLPIGNYKFLFLKTSGNAGLLSPALPDGTTSFEDVIFTALPDNTPSRTGYVLPVDEIWLPATEQMARTEYSITKPVSIKNTLTRAVSRITLVLKQGKPENGTMTEVPVTGGGHILTGYKEIQMDISGVGTTLDIGGGKGTGSTFYSMSTRSAAITEKGFAQADGPFLFPSADSPSSEITVTLIPQEESGLQPKTSTISGILERNKKLEITLWMGITDQIIEITVNKQEMSAQTGGDQGMWE